MARSNYNILIDKLDRFIKRYYKNELLKGSLLFIGSAVLLYVLMVLLEYVGHFGTGVRTTMFYVSIAFFSGVAWRFVIRPIMKLYRIGDAIDHDQAAKIVGSFFPEVKDKLLNAIQLGRVSNKENELLLASVDQKVDNLSPIPFYAAIDYKKNKKYLKYTLPPLAILLGVWLINVDALTEPTARIINHNKAYTPPAPFVFTMVNQDLRVVQNEEVEIRVKVTGRELPGSVSIVRDGSRFRMKKISKVEYAYSVRPDDNMHFRFVSGDVMSRRYELEVLPRPIIQDFEVELVYPKYIGSKTEILKSVGDLSVPEGTIAKWRFNTENVEDVIFREAGSDTLLAVRMDESALYNKTLVSSFEYNVYTSNEYITKADSMQYMVQVKKDEYPRIDVLEELDTTNSAHRYFTGSIQDDYGFNRLVFMYTHKNGENEGNTVIKEVDISKQKLSENFMYFWNMDELNLDPGDEISYYFTVWDNDGYNGNKSARSGTKLFKMPTEEELEEQYEETSETTKAELESAVKEASDLQKQMKELKQELSNSKSMNWQQKQRLEDLVERQLSLQDKMEKANEEFKRNNEKQEDYKALDEDYLEKREMLEKLMEELFTDEMKEMLKELQELMKDMNKNAVQEQMEQMEMDSEQMKEQMERALEHFKELQFQEKLDDVIKETEELAKEQEKLAEETKNKDISEEESLARQKELNEKLEEIKEDIEALNEKNDALEKKHDLEDTDKLAEEVEKEQEAAEESLENGKQKKGAESQKNAAEAAKKMAAEMKSMQAKDQAKRQEEDMDALRQLLENLIETSLEQENIMNDITRLDRNDPRYFEVGRRQRKLYDDSQTIKDSLFALSKRVQQLEAFVTKEIDDINYYMDKTLADIGERRTYEARSKQQYVMTSANNLALMLDEILQQMQQDMSSQMGGAGMCMKPGSNGKPNPSSLPSLREMQEQLAEQLKKAKKGMKGKKPGDGQKGQNGMNGKGAGQGSSPGEGGDGQNGDGMSEQLAKLAAQQAAIRERIKELKETLNEDGSGSGNGLNKIIEDMEKTEEDIIFERITQETIDRQKDILTRLLEHEKAERERDWDEKRESQEAKNDEYGNPDRVLEYKREKEKELELLRTIPPDLKSYYRNKVNNYFNSVD